ncbi:MAG: permease-like cell division protein FtsX [Gammaproteobacteria bacterium]|nr:permease-like cell division protein FtsX [Gammaproteobacteria bacterium]
MKNYFMRHLQVLFYSLGQLARTPLASLMSLLVIGISLALPAVLYVTLENIQQLSTGWGGNAQVSVFLKHGTNDADARALAAQLQQHEHVSVVQYIDPDAALAEFKQHSGFGDALDALDRNPLPGVLLVEPAENTSAAQLDELVETLGTLPQVDLAQLDMKWVKRLKALLEIARRSVLLLGGLLAVGVVLTTSNTIRLAILNRRQEIEIMKLIGATNAFIRRPFLYSGWFYGLFGGTVAWLLVTGGLWALAEPIQHLVALYGSDYRLAGLSAPASLVLLGGGALMGWLGARIAVSRHLAEIEPR